MATYYKDSLSRYRRYITLLQQQPLIKAGFVLILSLIFLIILLLAVLRPTLITISSLLGEINSQKEVEKRLDEKIASLQQAQLLLNSLQSRLVYLDNGLPTQASLALWTQAVETVAGGSGVVISDLTLSDIPLTPAADPSQLANLVKINFKITAGGEYRQLADFIDTVEKLPRLAILDSVLLTRSSGGELTLSAEGTISFTHAQKEY